MHDIKERRALISLVTENIEPHSRIWDRQDVYYFGLAELILAANKNINAEPAYYTGRTALQVRVAGGCAEVVGRRGRPQCPLRALE